LRDATPGVTARDVDTFPAAPYIAL